MKKSSFESLMTEIDRLVQKLEDPTTGLEESLELFEVGSHKIAQARQRLSKIQHGFEILQKKFGEGESNQRADLPSSSEQQGLDL